MYPAAAVTSGQITIDDLPEVVVGFNPQIIYPKVNPPITYFVAEEGGEQFTLYYGFEREGIGIFEGDTGSWGFQIDFGGEPIEGCLFSSLDGPPDWVVDDFEDTYTVFDPFLVFPEIGRDGTQQVNRASLCLWTGDGYDNVQESQRSILYNGNGSNGYPEPELPPDTWLILIPDGARHLKTGPDQSSPVGDYEGGITVYE